MSTWKTTQATLAVSGLPSQRASVAGERAAAMPRWRSRPERRADPRRRPATHPRASFRSASASRW